MKAAGRYSAERRDEVKQSVLRRRRRRKERLGGRVLRFVLVMDER